MNENQKTQIEVVTMDMWKAYMGAVKEELPASKICHDKFHLVKYLNDAVDKVRRSEVKNQEQLLNTRYIWLKDKMSFTEKQRLKFEAINQANFVTSKAWRIKENFREINFKQPFEEAYIIFHRWYMDAIKSGITQIVKSR